MKIEVKNDKNTYQHQRRCQGYPKVTKFKNIWNINKIFRNFGVVLWTVSIVLTNFLTNGYIYNPLSPGVHPVC